MPYVSILSAVSAPVLSNNGSLFTGLIMAQISGSGTCVATLRLLFDLNGSQQYAPQPDFVLRGVGSASVMFNSPFPISASPSVKAELVSIAGAGAVVDVII